MSKSSSSNNTRVEIKNLSRYFGQGAGRVTAVDDLSFSVKEGEVLGFLGPNGAGKSTTMKVITGFLSASAGSVTVAGHRIDQEPLAAKSLIGYLPEGAPCYGDMTVVEFLRFIAGVRGYQGDEMQQRLQRVLDEVELHSVAGQTIDTLSKGFKRRVGLAQAIMHDPKVLILDEPTDGLDPNQKHHVRELIKHLSQDKIVIISTHILEEVTAVCSRAIIIAAGKIVADGTPAELEARSRYHQAVDVRLARPYDIAPDLAGMEGIGKIQKVQTDGDEGAGFIVFAKDGAAIFSKVSQVAHSKAWPLAGLHAKRGQLEDVFRKVTNL